MTRSPFDKYCDPFVFFNQYYVYKGFDKYCDPFIFSIKIVILKVHGINMTVSNVYNWFISLRYEGFKDLPLVA